MQRAGTVRTTSYISKAVLYVYSYYLPGDEGSGGLRFWPAGFPPACTTSICKGEVRDTPQTGSRLGGRHCETALTHSASLPILQSTDAYGRWQRLCQLTDGARAGTHPTQTHHAHWPWTGTAYVFHRLSPALIEASWPGFKGLTMKLAGK